MKHSLTYIFDKKTEKVFPIDLKNPKDVLLFKGWEKDVANRLLHRTEYTDDIVVSTVFLMLDHNYHAEGDPVLWETMIIKDGEYHDWSRYDSYAKAKAGHKKACDFVERKIREATFPWYLFWKRWKREKFFDGMDA